MKVKHLIAFFGFMFFLTNVYSQVDEADKSKSFKYNGVDKAISDMNQYNKHYGGLSIKPINTDDEFFGVGFFVFYEYGFLLMPKNNSFNVSLNAMGQAGFAYANPLFLLFDVPVSANINFGSEAGTKSEDIGASFGVGYDFLFSSISYSETSPFFRAMISIENFYCGFQYNTEEDILFRYTLYGGVKLDF